MVGFALGLELSTLASVASGQFASAHEKLGRKHPQNGLKDDLIGKELFQSLMGDGWSLISCAPFTVCILLTPLPSHTPSYAITCPLPLIFAGI